MASSPAGGLLVCRSPLPPPLLLLWWVTGLCAAAAAAAQAGGSAGTLTAGTADSSEQRARAAALPDSDPAGSAAAWPGGARAGVSGRNVSPGYNSALVDLQREREQYEEEREPAASSDQERLAAAAADPEFLASLESLLLLGEDEQQEQDGDVMVMTKGEESDYGETVELHGQRGDQEVRTEMDGMLEERRGEQESRQEREFQVEQEVREEEFQMEMEFQETQGIQEFRYQQEIEEVREVHNSQEVRDSEENPAEQESNEMERPLITPWHAESQGSHSFSSFTRELFRSHVLGEEDRPLPSPPPLDPFVPIRSDDCGIDKGCFRYGAPGCDSTSCEYFLSYRRLGEDVEFELSADTDGWVAVGFSSDRLMGGDDVMACVHFNGRVRVQHYNNVGQWAREQPRNPARDDEAIFESGRVTCRFKRALAAHRDDAMVDLHLSWYYLLAWGPASHGLVTRHDMDTPPVTDSTVSVFRYEDVYMPSAAYQTCSSPGCLLVIVAITFYTLMGVP